MKKISLVVPMYYEEKVVNECYKRLTKVLSNLKNYDYEIIFVNDGSKDKTLELLQEVASKDKKVKVEYDYSDEESNNAKYADEMVKLKSIEVIEK